LDCPFGERPRYSYHGGRYHQIRIALPLYNLISLATAVIGFFLAPPLLALGSRRPANRWLAAFVFSMSSACLADYCIQNGVYARHPSLCGVFDWPLAGIGAAYYCYVRSLTSGNVSRRQLWHFLPVLVFALALFAPPWLQPSLRQGRAQWVYFRQALGALFPVILLMPVIYVVPTMWRLQQFRRRQRDSYSLLQGRDLAWLNGLTAVILALLAIWVLSSLFGGVWDWLLPLGRIALLYFVGWYGLRQAAVFVPDLLSAPVTEPMPAAVASPELLVEPTESSPEVSEKYARSGMTDAAGQLIGERLARRMTVHRDFLDPDLKLTELAESVGTSPQLLSQHINGVLGCNFFDYVNSLRIAEVQRLMQDPGMAGCTLLELALAAGFNSKSTFNTAFRKVTGMAPSAWRKQRVAIADPSLAG